MGFFDDIGETVSGLIGLDGDGSGGNIFFNRITDPLDLFGVRQQSAQERASELIRQGMDAATAAQIAAFETMLNITEPFRQAGIEALGPLQEEAFAKPGLSPGDRFRLGEAKKSIRQAQAARGLFKSGAGREAESRAAERIAAESESRRLGLLGTLLAGGQQQSGLAAQGALTTGAGRAETLTSGFGTQALFPLQPEPAQSVFGGAAGGILSLFA
jgi:hypothetical protein